MEPAVLKLFGNNNVAPFPANKAACRRSNNVSKHLLLGLAIIGSAGVN